jgi:hypothetical protein
MRKLFPLVLAAMFMGGCASPGSYAQDRVLDFIDIFGLKLLAGKGVKIGAELGNSYKYTAYDDFFGGPIVGGLRRHITPPNPIIGYYDFEEYGFQGRAAGVWRDKGIDLLGPIDRKLRAVAGNDYLYESVDEFNEGFKNAPETVPVPLDYPQPKYHYTGDIHLYAASFIGAQIDFSSYQLADFVLGWFHIDIVKDDSWNLLYREEDDDKKPSEELEELQQ